MLQRGWFCNAYRVAKGAAVGIDNGIGIEKSKFNLIFSGDYTTKESGSGLGLHSIANFVEGWGGKIYPLSDRIGKGTTMRVMLPLSSVIT